MSNDPLDIRVFDRVRRVRENFLSRPWNHSDIGEVWDLRQAKPLSDKSKSKSIILAYVRFPLNDGELTQYGQVINRYYAFEWIDVNDLVLVYREGDEDDR